VSSSGDNGESGADEVLTATGDWRVRYKGLFELFNFIRDGKYFNAECYNCGTTMKKAQSGRMVSHIKGCYCDRAARDNVIDEFRMFTARQIAKKERTVERVMGQEKKDAINDLILTFVGKNALPFHIVNTSSFIRLLNALDLNYEVVSANKLLCDTK